MSARLRMRAAGLIRQLDAGTVYREEIEKEDRQASQDGVLNLETRIPDPGSQIPLRLQADVLQHRTTPTRGSASTAARNEDCAMKPQAFGFRPWALGLVTWALCLVTLGSGIARPRSPCPTRRSFTGTRFRLPNSPHGTVTVRVVREAIGNNVTGQDVRLTVSGSAELRRPTSRAEPSSRTSRRAPKVAPKPRSTASSSCPTPLWCRHPADCGSFSWPA